MSHLKSRVLKMEKKVALKEQPHVIMTFSDEDEQRQRAEFECNHPGEKLLVLRVNFIDPKTAKPVPYEPSNRCYNVSDKI